MAEAKKDTIYIDVDDEITSIVEKVQDSKSKIVALVLPKRAVVLQSIVNMKLLKRTSDEVNKRVVLITSEAGLLPLAGAVGVYTAKNLQSKPEIPPAPESGSPEDELLESEEEDGDKELDKAAAVGALAGAGALKAASKDDDEDVFEQPSNSSSTKSPVSTASKAAKPKKSKKDKKNKVPNFEKFRLKVVIGVVGVLLLLLFSYWAFFIAPKATVAITTETSDINTTVDFTASLSATELNVGESIVPAKQVKQNDNGSEKAPATGNKDLGTKATGSVRLSISCGDVGGSPPTVPAGTGVSTGGLTFIVQSNTSLTTPSFSGGCQFIGTAGVTAQQNGEQYNIGSGKTFTVAGYSDVSGSNGDAFTGGTTNMATVVSQQDVDSAKSKIADNSESIKAQLKQELEDAGYFALTDTFSASESALSIVPEVDQEANEVTVSVERNYTMLGVNRDDLNELVKNDVNEEANQKSLQVQDDGIDDGVFRIGTGGDENNIPVSAQLQVALGPKIDEEALKQEIAGKKKGDVNNIVTSIQGVKEADISYSPFWVSTAPKNTAKITIEFKEAEN
ncbi:hypothetical protein KC950_02030 [Candidatus Saccharibacteria bacterium]|nr:hypothetical protein [Candidatus Saccharibacteria bacterium]